MSATPLVSLLIPVFNRVDFLPGLLDALQAQTYSHWEAILVDDGSTDGSFEWLENAVLSEPRLRVFKRPASHLPGGNAARNYAFSKSTGEWVNFIDSDDVLLPRFIESKLVALQTQTDFDGIVGKTQLVESDLSVPRLETRTSLDLYSLDHFIQFKFKLYFWDVLWKKSFLTSIGGKLFDPQLRKGQDFDFHLRVLAHAPKLVFTETVGYLYRYNPHAISSNYRSEVVETMLDSQARWVKSPLLHSISAESWDALFRYQFKALSFVTSDLYYFHRVAHQLWQNRKKVNSPIVLWREWAYEYLRGLKRILLKI